MSKPFRLGNFLISLSVIFFGLTIIYSIFNYVRVVNPDNISILTSDSQLSNSLDNSFLRVKIAKLEVLPLVYEQKYVKRVTYLVHITSESGVKFITALSEEKIKNEKIDVGSTIVFGAGIEDSAIQKKKSEILNELKSSYPEYYTENFMFLQGKVADIGTVASPIGSGLVVMILTFGLVTKFRKEEPAVVNSLSEKGILAETSQTRADSLKLKQ